MRTPLQTCRNLFGRINDEAQRRSLRRSTVPADTRRHVQPDPRCCDRCHPRGVQGARGARRQHVHRTSTSTSWTCTVLAGAQCIARYDARRAARRHAHATTRRQDVRGLSPFARLQLRAYTVWNLAFLGVRVALNQAQWDSFLAVNSFGIACGFRTAMCQGIGENMRKKLAAQLAHDGLDLPPWQVQHRPCTLRTTAPLHHCTSAPLHLSTSPSLYAYTSAPLQFFFSDHAIHTLPPLVLITALVRRAERVHPMVRSVASPNSRRAH